jgi:hypothetical protein
LKEQVQSILLSACSAIVVGLSLGQIDIWQQWQQAPGYENRGMMAQLLWKDFAYLLKLKHSQ